MNDVARAQRFANTLGVGLTVDDRNGLYTRRFVRMFQESFQLGSTKLVVDGIVGPATIKAMRESELENGAISAHFRYQEFRNKGSRIPSPGNHVVLVTRELVAALERLRESTGPIHIASGYRSRHHNKLVGGVPKSTHMAGLAVDLARSGMGVRVTEKMARDAGFKGVGMESRGNPSVIHVDVRPSPARWFYR